MNGERKTVPTVNEIVRLAGGDTVVARRFGYRDGRAVWNWRAKNCFPATTRDAWGPILEELQISAPPELWRQKKTKRSE